MEDECILLTVDGANGYFPKEFVEETVKKQIPKKPLDVHSPLVTWGVCPRCKGELSKLGGRPNRIFIGTRFCPDCGQALDWSDGERKDNDRL